MLLRLLTLHGSGAELGVLPQLLQLPALQTMVDAFHGCTHPHLRCQDGIKEVKQLLSRHLKQRSGSGPSKPKSTGKGKGKGKRASASSSSSAGASDGLMVSEADVMAAAQRLRDDCLARSKPRLHGACRRRTRLCFLRSALHSILRF